MEKVNRKEAEEKIKKFFQSKKKAEEVRKIKRLAMHHNIKLGELRKKFCKKCYSMNLRVKGIRKGIKSVECRECGNLMRWKIK